MYLAKVYVNFRLQLYQCKDSSHIVDSGKSETLIGRQCLYRCSLVMPYTCQCSAWWGIESELHVGGGQAAPGYQDYLLDPGRTPSAPGAWASDPPQTGPTLGRQREKHKPLLYYSIQYILLISDRQLILEVIGYA